MDYEDLSTFPEFKWVEFFWVTSAKLPAWAGYQIRRGPYGSLSANGRSDGTVRIIFAPEGRGEGSLSNEEIRLVKWLIDNQTSVHDATLKRLFEEYPAMRERWLGWFNDDEANEVLPDIRFSNQLKDIVGISSIIVHPIEQDGRPFIGVELGCTWEAEHGVGILLHGDNPLEIGGADTAITLWIAKKYLSNQS
ncbi:MAG: hypothetical protein U0929_06030 [Planctomycetaceae bacterium]